MPTGTTTPLPERTLRKGDLPSLVQILQDQHAAKVDVVMPAADLLVREHADGAFGFDFPGLPPQVSNSGVTSVAGLYVPTPKAIAQVADKFGVPTAYLRRCADENRDLFASNVEGWARRDDRKMLVRLLYGQDPEHRGVHGIMRAVLSDSYGVRDNIDVVLAMLDGMRAAGLDADNIAGADLSDDRMYLRVIAPEIQVMAPRLLAGYRSPFSGKSGDELPIVHAGILVKNSETGGGALSITPELRVLICDNGLQMTPDAIRSVHLGARLEEGQINWSVETRAAYDDLIRSKVKDAVGEFLTPEYVQAKIAKLEETSDKPVDHKSVEQVAKTLRYSESETQVLLSHFTKGASPTAGGVLHAVTSVAQEISDVDRSNEFAATGLKAMELAAAL